LTPVPNTATRPKQRVGQLRRGVYAVPEQGYGAGGVSLALNRFLIVLIVVTLSVTAIESVPEMARTYALPLSVIEWTATLVFSLEYAARIWCATEHPLLERGAVFERLRALPKKTPI
jgi:voltage-gated potassium channel